MRCITLYVFIFFTHSAFCQIPELKRVCPNINNNNLTWINPGSACPSFYYYIIWASPNKGGPYTPIDSVTSEPATSYTHVNANPYTFYYIERRDSCGPVYNHISDTVGLDNEITSITILDSVSVNIATNQVILGWRSNPTPDFDKYIVYKYTPPSTFLPIDPNGIRDTFSVDNTGSNPQAGALTYDINTKDSCGNAAPFKTPHTTIHLTHAVDTCSKKVILSWSHYVGWRGIRQYEIYENSGSGFSLLTTTGATTTTYSKSIILGTAYEYFVRAFKDTTTLVSSSSNKVSFTTRKRIDPDLIRINYVSTDNLNSENIFFNFSAIPPGETKSFVAVFTDPSLVEKDRIELDQSDMNTEVFSNLKNTSRYLLKISAYDLCDSVSSQSDSSTNILLTKEETAHRSMRWNSYFTWNNGVEKYIIYRGTGEEGSYFFSPWEETFDTSITDSNAIDNLLGYGVCYYIKAIKGGSDTSSISNILCFPSPFVVFIPTAFVPTGINALFRPEGSAIDYQASTMQIYDRWGKLVFSGPVAKGWNGSDQNNQACMDGIYHYKADMISVKKERQTKNGTVTLLR